MENPEGRGEFEAKKPSVGGVWIFSGITHHDMNSSPVRRQPEIILFLVNQVKWLYCTVWI